MNWTELDSLASRFGDAFFLYDEPHFLDNLRCFSSAFRAIYPGTRVGYSFKTNYTPDLCAAVFRAGEYAEVVSAMEYELARRLGFPGSRIIYNGPARSAMSLCRALADGAIVNLDSLRDLWIVYDWVSKQTGKIFNVGLRCTFPLDDAGSSRFGFDVDGEELQQALTCLDNTPGLRLAGVHCHFPCRDLPSFKKRIQQLLLLAANFFDKPPDYLNIGGGFFGYLPPTLRIRAGGVAPSFADYAEAIATPMARAYPDPTDQPVLFTEPGTALVADTFRFVARVVSIKKSIRGRRIATVAGSMFNISPYARLRTLPVEVVRKTADGVVADASDTLYDVCGYTCIEGDVLSEEVQGPFSEGDFIVFSNVGSYSIVMKPPFIEPGVPILLINGSNSASCLIKEAETMDHIFATFPRFRQ